MVQKKFIERKNCLVWPLSGTGAILLLQSQPSNCAPSNCAPSNCARLPNCALFQEILRDCPIVHVFSDPSFIKRLSNCAHFSDRGFTNDSRIVQFFGLSGKLFGSLFFFFVWRGKLNEFCVHKWPKNTIGNVFHILIVLCGINLYWACEFVFQGLLSQRRLVQIRTRWPLKIICHL